MDKPLGAATYNFKHFLRKEFPFYAIIKAVGPTLKIGGIMKSKIKTILMFSLMFIWFTLSYGRGWAFSSLDTVILQRDRYFTCTNQGIAGDKTVVVQVSYNESKGIPEKVVAVDTTYSDKPQPLKCRLVDQPFFFMREKNPTNPESPEVRAFPGVKVGPFTGSVICTKDNYPVYVWGNKAWFIYQK